MAAAAATIDGPRPSRGSRAAAAVRGGNPTDIGPRTHQVRQLVTLELLRRNVVRNRLARREPREKGRLAHPTTPVDDDELGTPGCPRVLEIRPLLASIDERLRHSRLYLSQLRLKHLRALRQSVVRERQFIEEHVAGDPLFAFALGGLALQFGEPRDPGLT